MNKFNMIQKLFALNPNVKEEYDVFYIKREKKMKEFWKKLNKPNEIPICIYYGPFSSGKTSFLLTLDEPKGGIRIM
jgi:predicted AAA+ superfamily ATPase